MRKDWKYFLYLCLAFGLFVVVKLFSPKQHDWTITYAREDKDPYGAFAFGRLLPDLFADKGIWHDYKTVYEIKDSLSATDNIVIICSRFNPDREDSDELLDHVYNGGTAFISAQYFYGVFSDTLQLSTYDYFFKSGNIFTRKDSSILRFVNASLDTTREFVYRRDNVHNYFNRFDTARTTVIAKNDYANPVTIRMKHGRGNFILNSTPLIFTNIYLLSANNHEFVSKTLSYLPVQNVKWTEYYHLGRREAETPLRFILTNEPLRWAYYITIVSLLVFMIFEMKRKQRIIPIIKPLSNTTLEFVGTIGNLYFQSNEHKNIAEKKINFFMEQLRTKHWLSTAHLDESFIKLAAKKIGKPEEDVRHLVTTIIAIKGKAVISADELIDLNNQIEKINLSSS